MKEKIKKIKPQTVLIITALIIVIFSIFSLVKINRLDYLIYKKCEPRTYTEWTKKVKVPLTPERIKELKTEIARLNIKFAECKNEKGLFCDLFREKILGYKTEILKQGYEIKKVPDEDRREQSRREVEDYKKCLKNQESAIKQHPGAYKFLFIINGLILIIGFLITFALYFEGRKK